MYDQLLLCKKKVNDPFNTHGVNSPTDAISVNSC